MIMPTMSMQRGTDAQKKLEGIAEIVSVVEIESAGTVVEGKLRAEADINAVAMR
jgi:hypothetical protein